MLFNDDRPFPIQDDWNWKKGRDYRPLIHNPRTFIPWWLAEEAYETYSKYYGKQQSLEHLAERGGFGRSELLMLLRKEKL